MDPSFSTYRDPTGKGSGSGSAIGRGHGKRSGSTSSSSGTTTKAASKAAARKNSSKHNGKHKLKNKKSGVRTKFLIESLRQEYYQQRDENEWLRGLVIQHLPRDKAQAVLASCFDATNAAATSRKLPSSCKEIDALAAQMIPTLTMDEGDNEDDEDDGMSDDDAVGF